MIRKHKRPSIPSVILRIQQRRENLNLSNVWALFDLLSHFLGSIRKVRTQNLAHTKVVDYTRYCMLYHSMRYDTRIHDGNYLVISNTSCQHQNSPFLNTIYTYYLLRFTLEISPISFSMHKRKNNQAAHFAILGTSQMPAMINQSPDHTEALAVSKY